MESVEERPQLERRLDKPLEVQQVNREKQIPSRRKNGRVQNATTCYEQ